MKWENAIGTWKAYQLCLKRSQMIYSLYFNTIQVKICTSGLWIVFPHLDTFSRSKRVSALPLIALGNKVALLRMCRSMTFTTWHHSTFTNIPCRCFEHLTTLWYEWSIKTSNQAFYTPERISLWCVRVYSLHINLTLWTTCKNLLWPQSYLSAEKSRDSISIICNYAVQYHKKMMYEIFTP